jgi:HSP20 family molecular chaperone IbpA
MAVVRWKPGFFGWHRDPFSEMNRLRREMDRVFGDYAGGRGIAPAAGVFPALNLSEDDYNLYVRAELPGVPPEDIEMTTKENNLILKGELVNSGVLSPCPLGWIPTKSRRCAKMECLL